MLCWVGGQWPILVHRQRNFLHSMLLLLLTVYTLETVLDLFIGCQRFHQVCGFKEASHVSGWTWRGCVLHHPDGHGSDVPRAQLGGAGRCTSRLDAQWEDHQDLVIIVHIHVPQRQAIFFYHLYTPTSIWLVFGSDSRFRTKQIEDIMSR